MEEVVDKIKSNWSVRQAEKKRGFESIKGAAPPSIPRQKQQTTEVAEQPKYVDDEDWSDESDEDAVDLKKQKL